jgi:hypothetical protein
MQKSALISFEEIPLNGYKYYHKYGISDEFFNPQFCLVSRLIKSQI